MKNTENRVMFDRKELALLIVPLAAEQILFAAIGIADMLMVAAAGEQSVSAISLVDSLNLLFHSIFSALAAGGGILFTQYFGRRDYENANYAAKHLVAVSILLSLLIAGACFFGNRMILHLLYGTAEPAVLKLSVTYFYLALASYPMVMLYSTCACLFRGMGKTRFSLCGAAVSCFSNILLNAVFIYGLGLGVLGAGLASLLAKTGGALLMIFFLIRNKSPIRMQKFLHTGWNKKMFVHILRLAVSVISMWVFRVGCSYLFREILEVGVICVWLAMFLDWAFRAVVYALRFRSGKWKTKTFI